MPSCAMLYTHTHTHTIMHVTSSSPVLTAYVHILLSEETYFPDLPTSLVLPLTWTWYIVTS